MSKQTDLINIPDAIAVSGSNVGIGTSSPTSPLHITGSGHTAVTITAGTSSDAQIRFGDSGDTDSGMINYDNTVNALKFVTNGADRMRITSSGNVGINTSSPDAMLTVDTNVGGSSTGTLARFHASKGESDSTFLQIAATRHGTASVQRVQLQAFDDDGSTGRTLALNPSGGSVGIGLNDPSARLEIAGMAAGEQALLIESGRNDALSNGLARINITDSNCPFAGLQIDHAGTGAAIISNGDVLVGKTSTASMGSDTVGHTLYAGGTARHIVNGGEVMNIGRLNSDGSIIGLYKDGITIGTIGVVNTDHLVIAATYSNGTGIKFSNNLVKPVFDSGADKDNAANFGSASARWNDLYATNGTIQTSDFNEKQDIASLTATEMLVGKRISTLFKTFRWKDSVAENGDNARTHTGVIAQDVQAAFTTEGLDAGDYALFISSTWWETQTEVPAVEAVAEVEAVTETTTDEDGNEVVTVITEAVEAVEAKDAYTRTDTYDTEAEAPEGATEKTRMGIRYPELLSFVAAYNEQRFASIEARLTALEA
jgi:hypothetical protein